MRCGFLTACLLATTIATTALAGPKVEFDPDADFSSYRTYQWKAGTPAPDERIQQRIEQAIDGRLEASGLVRQEASGDLIAVTHLSTASDTMGSGSDFGYGGWPGWGARGGKDAQAIEVSELPGGTLIVDLVDTKTNKLVWRGVASGTIKGTGEKAEANVDKKIGKLFRQFPPQDVE